MNFENYDKEEKIIDLVKANSDAFKYLAFFTLIFGLPFYLLWGFSFPEFSLQNIILTAFLVIAILFLGIIIHELIHGIFFALFASTGFKSIKFGFLMKTLTPYCHCKEPLKIKHYTFALLAPLVFLGIVPSIISLFTGSVPFLVFGIFFSGAAAGDLMIYALIKKENPDDFVQDHPSEAGYYIYKKLDNSKI